MHVVLTNDDGPLNDKLCPYFKYLVDEIITTTDWDLSIVVPDQQRSWIGKAHLLENIISKLYLYQSINFYNPKINSFEGPFLDQNPNFIMIKNIKNESIVRRQRVLILVFIIYMLILKVNQLI